MRLFDFRFGLLLLLLIAMFAMAPKATADWPRQKILCDAQICLPKWLGGGCMDLCEGRPEK